MTFFLIIILKQQHPRPTLQLNSSFIYLKSLWSCILFRVAFSPMLIKSKEYTVLGLGVVLD
jgi:hypothetical protein